MFSVASLFSGVGGLDWGFDQHDDFIMVFANDFEPTACNTYRLNFPHSSIYLKEGDITAFIDEIPAHDLLLGGFPCQAFSLAGKREGFDDTKGRGLHYESCKKVLNLRKPSFFVFENVGGLSSHNKGKTLEIIKEAFRKEGYRVHCETIKMNEYGIPQRRVRLLFFGVRSDLSFDPQWMVPKKPQIDQETLKLKYHLNPNVFPILPTATQMPNHNYHVGNGATKVYWMKIVSEPGENLYKLPKELVRMRQQKLLELENLPIREKIPQSQLGYRRLDDQVIAPTMMFGNTCLPIHPKENRSISVREAAYIQSFPLDFEFTGGIASQYKQVGNAVPPKFSLILSSHLAQILKGVRNFK